MRSAFTSTPRKSLRPMSLDTAAAASAYSTAVSWQKNMCICPEHCPPQDQSSLTDTFFTCPPFPESAVRSLRVNRSFSKIAVCVAVSSVFLVIDSVKLINPIAKSIHTVSAPPSPSPPSCIRASPQLLLSSAPLNPTVSSQSNASSGYIGDRVSSSSLTHRSLRRSTQMVVSTSPSADIKSVSGTWSNSPAPVSPPVASPPRERSSVSLRRWSDVNSQTYSRLFELELSPILEDVHVVDGRFGPAVSAKRGQANLTLDYDSETSDSSLGSLLEVQIVGSAKATGLGSVQTSIQTSNVNTSAGRVCGLEDVSAAWCAGFKARRNDSMLMGTSGQESAGMKDPYGLPYYRFAWRVPPVGLEIAIIATDLAELLGSAIALCLLFPKLQLWHGVLLTAVDVILILAIKDPLGGRPVRMFEFLIAAMVLAVLICMAVIISQVDVDWGDAFQGYLPSKYIFASGGLYTSIGIIGATVMPHSLFLGSALATQDRIECRQSPEETKLAISTTSTRSSEDFETLTPPPRSLVSALVESTVRLFRAPPASPHATPATRHSEHENNPFSFVKAHIYHGIADVVTCLLGFAVLINSMYVLFPVYTDELVRPSPRILILASAVFYYGQNNHGDSGPASLFDAYDLIRDLAGQPAATLFAIALLASGQSSSFIATLAGQAVSEGFIQWRVSPVIRRLLTRLIAIIPSMIVAVAVGRDGIDALLVASQVILSVVLPFITFPLLYCTSSKTIMRSRKCQDDGRQIAEARAGDVENSDQWVDYSNSKFTTAVGIAIWLVVVAANTYVLVSLAMGIDR
ncbi:hypothetical protein D9756_006228 [Leucocoprinus leucothites]|uniref:Nramp-domain-containing protein n=1 Tax=Leucocoprinus leucothites TaxID=201217 RepID=A0A8H5D355_9AGAR|nr:hypothetical protein D9756_006228 [Leucoagaricus leucothites]